MSTEQATWLLIALAAVGACFLTNRAFFFFLELCERGGLKKAEPANRVTESHTVAQETTKRTARRLLDKADAQVEMRLRRTRHVQQVACRSFAASYYLRENVVLGMEAWILSGEAPEGIEIDEEVLELAAALEEFLRALPPPNHSFSSSNDEVDSTLSTTKRLASLAALRTEKA